MDDPAGPDQSIAPRSASAQPSTQDTTPDSETQQPSPSQVTSAISDSGNAGPVTCWDASSAPAADQCPVPAGRAGMVTVFPDLTHACAEVASPIEGKAEVYECLHDGFIVRFTRWDQGFDKERYYEVENQVASQPWEIAGEAGRTPVVLGGRRPRGEAAVPVVGRVRRRCRSRSASRVRAPPTAAPASPSSTRPAEPGRAGALTAQKSNRVAPPGSTVCRATAETGVIR